MWIWKQEKGRKVLAFPFLHKTDVTIDNINGVGTIEVPQEVLDEAKPMEGALGGGEFPDTASSNPSTRYLVRFSL